MLPANRSKNEIYVVVDTNEDINNLDLNKLIVLRLL